MKIKLEDGRVFECSDNCTKCGKDLKGEGGFPLPEKQFLCRSCFMPALNRGLGEVNKKINKKGLGLSLDEISESFEAKEKTT